MDRRKIGHDAHLVFGGEAAAHLPEEVRGVLGEPDADQVDRMRATLVQSLSQPR